MRFSGQFAESLLSEQLDRVSLSFLVEDLQIRRGGIAPNICFGLAAHDAGRLILAAEIAAAIGVDSLAYLSLDGMLAAVPDGPRGFCHACFSGDYPLTETEAQAKDACGVLAEALHHLRHRRQPGGHR